MIENRIALFYRVYFILTIHKRVFKGEDRTWPRKKKLRKQRKKK